MTTEVTPEALPEAVGRYRVVRLLGRGAMGRVYLAHDPVLDREVAVKLLRDDLGLSPEHRRALLERMRQEARASARVSHPNIVTLHDMGDDDQLGLYLVFEYAEGRTLKERLTRGPLDPVATARLARELGDALSTAHAAGVLHRDIKPENVILTRTGAKIADFGIARVPDSTLTLAGGLLGTPAYSAPEAIAQGHFSPASDQFSLAATLWEALSGRRAFPGEDAMSVASRIATEEPPRIAEVCRVDPRVDVLFARALAKAPRSRFPSAADLGSSLAAALDAEGQGVRAPLVTIPGAERSPRGEVVRASVALALGAVLGVGGTLLATRLEESTAPPDALAPLAPESITSALPAAGSGRDGRRPAPTPPRKPAPSSTPRDAASSASSGAAPAASAPAPAPHDPAGAAP